VGSKYLDFCTAPQKTDCRDIVVGSPSTKKGLAPDHDFGDIRVVQTLISPARRDTGPPSLAGFVFLGLKSSTTQARNCAIDGLA
jgi:hypothetical protein